ncbi:MAG: TonB-dependent receptor plug domain-containing protein [Phycisphaeraceae bacterium]
MYRLTSRGSRGWEPSHLFAWFAVCLFAAVPSTALAQEAADTPNEAEAAAVEVAEDADDIAAEELLEMDMEALMDMEVTSATKTEGTSLTEAPAAIYVIADEDIDRSGLQSLPELLRLVPGMHVARVDAHTWAIAARGFNAQFNNKQLVMIDGRSVYTPLFGGVYWDMQDVVIEDLDRIEVIRGPGGSLWGANAVNGVVNVITKDASETQGWMLETSVGTEMLNRTAVRYGGQLGDDAYFRVYGKYVQHDDYVYPDGSDGSDGADEWYRGMGGFRMDFLGDENDKVMVQGGAFGARLGQELRIWDMPVVGTQRRFEEIDANGAYLLGEWAHTFEDDSLLTLQSYYDYTERNEVINPQSLHKFDVELEHVFRPWEDHQVIWGLGYRLYSDDNDNGPGVTFDPASRTDHTYSAFIQDTIELVEDRFSVTLGTKVEHNDYSGFEYQPSFRSVWTPSEQHAFWGAVSRAVRTPTRFQEDGQLTLDVVPTPFGPMPIRMVGKDDLPPEKLIAYEVGHRWAPSRNFFLDTTAFYNEYDDLSSMVPASQPMTLTFASEGEAESYGLETSATWQVTSDWELRGSYSLLRMFVHGGDESVEDGYPVHQAQVHSYVDVTDTVGFNTSLYWYDQVASAGTGIPSFFRLDTGVTWRPRENVEIGLWGQNLLDGEHAEYSAQTFVPTEVERSAYLAVKYEF